MTNQDERENDESFAPECKRCGQELTEATCDCSELRERQDEYERACNPLNR